MCGFEFLSLFDVDLIIAIRLRLLQKVFLRVLWKVFQKTLFYKLLRTF